MTPSEVAEWYADEKEGYANLISDDYRYGYCQLNIQACFNHLPNKRFNHALGFGSAFGNEFEPITNRLNKITIVESSDLYPHNELNGKPLFYVKPTEDGALPFADGEFDLLTCFGVLHHIANVRQSISEFYRCLAPGGYALIREPSVYMGRWEGPSTNRTKRERGLPLDVMLAAFSEAGFDIQHVQPCCCGAIRRAARFFHVSPWKSVWITWFDMRLANRLPKRRYQSSRWHQKIGPGAMAYTLRKQV